jgi:hypothetical protein
MSGMAGTWTSTGEMNGMKYLDTVRTRWGLNKQFLITDVTSTSATGPKKTYFEGHGLLRHDADKHQYVMHWFDGYGSMQIFTGDLKDNVLTLTSKGDNRTEVLTFTLGKGSYRLSMDAAAGTAPLKREWETTYTKVRMKPPAANSGEEKKPKG